MQLVCFVFFRKLNFRLSLNLLATSAEILIVKLNLVGGNYCSELRPDRPTYFQFKSHFRIRNIAWTRMDHGPVSEITGCFEYLACLKPKLLWGTRALD